MRTWGIAGELLTKSGLTEKSVGPFNLGVGAWMG